MDICNYENLFSKTKLKLGKVIDNEILDAITLSNDVSMLLDDCSTCVYQCLHRIPSLIRDEDTSRVICCLEDSMSLLQLLSNLLRNIIEKNSTSCNNLKSLPVNCGQVILIVFTHCKESEFLYGKHLKVVERQLKDLFRHCHELQLMYLMILDKYYVFDLSEMDELQTLIDALNLNLKIGEAVLNLDLKTMAEQWKAYTMLCEKYSNNLLDKDVFTHCITCLCGYIKSNITTAIEAHHNDEENKLILRSLKVTSFLIKILIKICQIVKCSIKRDWQQIMHLLIYIKSLKQLSFRRMNKNNQIMSMIEVNVLVGADNLMKELLVDDSFYKSVYQIDLANIENDNRLLGYILLITNIMKNIVEKNMALVKEYSLEKLVDKIFIVIPFCYNLFNCNSKHLMDCNNEHTFPLYEYVLLHTAAFTALLDSKQYTAVERSIYEAVLGTECLKALFASDLWTILASVSNAKLRYETLLFLCETYRTLRNNPLFHTSPQQVHLTYTMEGIFRTMSDDEKDNLSTDRRLEIESDIDLWSVLKVRNLPAEQCKRYEAVLFEKLKIHLDEFTNENHNDIEDIDELIKTLKVIATCPLIMLDDVFKDGIINLWMKLCSFDIGTVIVGTIWYLDYMNAVSSVITTMLNTSCLNSGDIIKILHIILGVMKSSSNEFKLIAVNLLLDITKCKILNNDNRKINAILCDIIKILFADEDDLLKTMKLDIVDQLANTKCKDMIIKTIKNDPDIRSTWSYAIEGDKVIVKNIDVQEDSCIDISKINFKHKCLEKQKDTCGEEIENTRSGNFEFANIDSFFDMDSESEQPLSKKAKVDTSDIDTVLSRLENETASICNINDILFTIEHRSRIKCIREKLRNIVND